jgi:8-oxo-dGTP diphosphatase
VIDLLFRLAYRSVYRLMRLYWAVFQPATHGALVALWHGGEILLVQNSYVPYRSLPGGYVRRGETGREAARRELLEEVGLRVECDDLELVLDVHHRWEGKRDHVELFELRWPERPSVRVDNREVVEARLFSPEQALALELFPPVRQLIERKVTGAPRG